MSEELIEQVTNMMQQPLRPAGSGVENFDRTVHPPSGPIGDQLSVLGVDASKDWGWLDLEHPTYWHRIYIFSNDDPEDENAGYAAITLTHHYKDPVGFEEIFDYENQLALSVVVAKGRPELSRRVLGQEFSPPAELLEQVKARTGPANLMIEQIQNHNFMAQVDNTCRYRTKRQSAAYVLAEYIKSFAFMSMLGYRSKPSKGGGVLFVRDVQEVDG